VDGQDLVGKYAFGVLGCVNSYQDNVLCGYGKHCRACRLLNAIQQAFERDQGFRDVEHRLRVLRDGSPEELVLLASGTLFEGKEGRRLLVALQDISKFKTIEQELRESREAEKTAHKSKSMFLSMMSHEMRTPLNAVLGFGELLKMEGLPESRHRELLDDMLKAGRHLLELINDSLDLAKIESGEFQVEVQKVDILGVIEESLSLLRGKAKKKGIRFEIDIESDEPPLAADRRRLKQVLLNLVGNAVKYNRPEGRVLLRLDQAQESGHRRILVEDTGVGIPPDRLHELFEPFKRLEAEKLNIEGSGIGLNLSKRLMERMNGSIGLAYTSKQGSAFFVELPVFIEKKTEMEMETKTEERDR
ncbi:MAG TPA: hypothetical protein ENN41_01940, partial [Sediminispirochaeta sp.]|nr:hypothetical protein [Sediminispirochaeta sp.]